METVVNIPATLYERAKQLADTRCSSPDEILGEALQQYLDRQANITDAMNRSLEDAGEEDRTFVNAAARRILANTEW